MTYTHGGANPHLPNGERLQNAGLLNDVNALNPKQQAAIEFLSSEQVDHLIDLFQTIHTNFPDVQFEPELGDGPNSDII